MQHDYHEVARRAPCGRWASCRASDDDLTQHGQRLRCLAPRPRAAAAAAAPPPPPPPCWCSSAAAPACPAFQSHHRTASHQHAMCCHRQYLPRRGGPGRGHIFTCEPRPATPARLLGVFIYLWPSLLLLSHPTTASSARDTIHYQPSRRPLANRLHIGPARSSSGVLFARGNPISLQATIVHGGRLACVASE